MRRLVTLLRTFVVSRAVIPLAMLCFLLLYTVTAFFTEEPLMTLQQLTRATPLILLLALIPLNSGARLVLELRRSIRRRAVSRGESGECLAAELFDEALELPAAPPLERLQQRLHAGGYRTRLTRGALFAWRGVSLSPARIVLLTATFALFAGILISTALRRTHRDTAIEGEPFLPSAGVELQVNRILLNDYPGIFLDRTLSIEAAERNGVQRVFGLYPPALYHGFFVYPRYLGIAPLIRFTAPDLKSGFETHFILSIYPPGKEDSAAIPGTPYRIVFSLAPQEGDNDPFRTGNMTLVCRVLKGEEPVAAGNLPMGGSFARNGYQLSFAGFRRVVTVDLVRDYGVIGIWGAALLYLAALLFWLPVRLFFPRQEMLFLDSGPVAHAFSRAEGGRMRHGGAFNEALDLLAAENFAGLAATGNRGTELEQGGVARGEAL